MPFSAEGIMIRKWEMKSEHVPEYFKSTLGSTGVDLWIQIPVMDMNTPPPIKPQHKWTSVMQSELRLNESGGVIGIRSLWGSAAAPSQQGQCWCSQRMGSEQTEAALQKGTDERCD